MDTIDTGDVVFHTPTGETWTVAYVVDGRLAWCGWPNGEAALVDCVLVRKATVDDRLRLLVDMANITGNDSRGRYARWRLENWKDSEEKSES